jgi:hypothetical protein
MIYTSNSELVHEEIIPYSSDIGSNKNYNDIIGYGITKVEEKYDIPDNIKIDVKQCSASIAGKYIPSSKSIIICQEFIRYIEQKYKALDLSDYSKSIDATILFILYHETAHMFIDIRNLPVVGNEEIASDQFAALMLLEDDLLDEYLEAYKKLIDAVDDDIPAWDEHPSYKQQYYNLACLLYGHNNDDALAKELHNRADRCNYEYNNAKEGWFTLLNNYE